MFAVFKTLQCSESTWDVLLFVTPNEQTAEDGVALAQLEYQAALQVPDPFLHKDAKKMSRADLNKLLDEYHANCNKLLTIDKPEDPKFFDRNAFPSYFYEPVEVRHSI